jgi:hypothetical protein
MALRSGWGDLSSSLLHTCRNCRKGRRTAERDASKGIGLLKGETTVAQKNRQTRPSETGEQVPARPHDSGSAANETVDGLDATTEALRHAAEDTPCGAAPDDIEKTPVFDRAREAPRI